MVTAMAYPDLKRGNRYSRTSKNEALEVSSGYVSQARYVLRNNPIPEGEHYPQRCLAIMSGTLSLTEAYDLTQADVKKREEEEAARLQAEEDAKLAEAERQKVEAERQAQANYEANRAKG